MNGMFRTAAFVSKDFIRMAIDVINGAADEFDTAARECSIPEDADSCTAKADDAREAVKLLRRYL